MCREFAFEPSGPGAIWTNVDNWHILSMPALSDQYISAHSSHSSKCSSKQDGQRSSSSLQSVTSSDALSMKFVRQLRQK